jgi:hypothetical protein
MPNDASGVFATLPDLFFSPLASQNREQYAALLVMYYRIFQESPHGVEKPHLMTRYAEYIALHFGQIAAEEQVADEAGTGEAERQEEISLFDRAELDALPGAMEPARLVAGRFLRTLIRAGWMSEETLPDFSKVVNMAPYAKPFFEALARVEEGLKTEYESHVVAVYSLLCGDAAKDNGHYAVLNAHGSTVALIDSLKVLSQSIRNHYERLTDISATADVRDLLHLHYDLYANDVLDGAYKRLKTSDNLYRYRPLILSRVAALLADGEWVASSAQKYARISRIPDGEARQKLTAMLEEIRDTLRAVDPLLEEIDRRNMLYAKASVERVRARLEPESSIAGKIAILARAILESGDGGAGLAHRVYRTRIISGDSRYRRWIRETLDPEEGGEAIDNGPELERAEAELRLRLARQLSPTKIAAWLDESGGIDKPVAARHLVRDADSFVRLLYAVIYAESRRGAFAYRVEGNQTADEERSDADGRIRVAGYEMPDLVFRRQS